MQFTKNIKLLILSLSVLLFNSKEYGTKYSWQLLNDRNWQIVSNNSEPSYITDSKERTRGNCPTGMVEVSGLMKQDPNPGIFSGKNIDAQQKLACINWLNRDPWWRDRCKQYDRDKWLQMSINYATKPMKFCIDRFEAGINKGEYPPILINYNEAKQICEYRGKRLCSEDEWVFSCEGPEAIPYPYGYTRDVVPPLGLMTNHLLFIRLLLGVVRIYSYEKEKEENIFDGCRLCWFFYCNAF